MFWTSILALFIFWIKIFVSFSGSLDSEIAEITATPSDPLYITFETFDLLIPPILIIGLLEILVIYLSPSIPKGLAKWSVLVMVENIGESPI